MAEDLSEEEALDNKDFMMDGDKYKRVLPEGQDPEDSGSEDDADLEQNSSVFVNPLAKKAEKAR